MRFRILPYKSYSKSAKRLAEAVGGKRLKLVGSTFVKRDGDVIINWGNSSCPWPLALNSSIFPAGDKLKFMWQMKDSGNEEIIPRFWTSKENIPDDAFPIVCRTILNGHSGRGIVIANTRDSLVECDLYVQYIKKLHEYRVHLGKNGTIAVQHKRRKNDHQNPNWMVRSHDNGFVYTRQNVDPPSCVVDVARKAFDSSGLDFGAVDVIYNSALHRAYVLEINTAPGLEGSTVEDYANYFKELVTS